MFINGANWKELPDGMGMSAIKAALVPVVEEVQTGKSAFYLCLEGQGIIGSLLILALCICMVMQIYKNHDRDWPVTGVLTMVAGVFFCPAFVLGRMHEYSAVVCNIRFICGFYRERKGEMRKILVLLIAICSVGAMAPVLVYAGEEQQRIEMQQMMEATERIEAREEPDEEAGIVFVYEKGAKVFVIEETSDGWFKVFYQGREGYIPDKGLVLQEMDTVQLDKELETAVMEGEIVAKEVERYRKEEGRSKVWGTVIALLIGGIFAVGIIAARKQGKNNAAR